MRPVIPSRTRRAISAQFAVSQQLLDAVEAKGLSADEHPGGLIAVENSLRGLMMCEWLNRPTVDSDARG